MCRKLTICLLFVVLFLMPLGVSAQHQYIASRQVQLEFDVEIPSIDPSYVNYSNQYSLFELSRIIDSLQFSSDSQILSIDIDSYVSLAEDSYISQRLSVLRSVAVRKHIGELHSVDSTLFTLRNSGVRWANLRDIVAESNVPQKEQVLAIIDRSTASAGDVFGVVENFREELLQLDGGESYRYLEKYVFPLVVASSVVTIYFNSDMCLESVEQVEQVEPTLEVETSVEPLLPFKEQTNIMALKTNLLYYTVLASNLEFEFPIKKHWSISVEFVVPWYTSKDNMNALQMLSTSVEGKYWYANCNDSQQLTGWFTGVYFGGGAFDVEYQGSGYQGEFFFGAGLSAGYAHTINSSGSLRMEYGVGVGYMQANYCHYETVLDGKYLSWKYDGTTMWFGPTELKVSLVWMLGRKGGRR